MEYRVLGNTGWKISTLSMGCAPLQSRVGKRDSIRALHSALEHGINFFDTANTYGQGQSEMVLGEVLQAHRSQVFICTKAGQSVSAAVSRLVPLKRIVGPFIRPFRGLRKAAGRFVSAQTQTDGYSETSLINSIEGSLRRLQRETIDLLLLHSPSEEVIERGEAFEVLEKQKALGKIRAYGVSCNTLHEAEVTLRGPHSGISAIQISFNVFEPEAASKLFGEATRKKIGIIARAPFAQGRIWHPENLNGLEIQRLASLHSLQKNEGATLAQAAIHWVLRHPEVTTVLASQTQPSHLLENTQGLMYLSA